MKPTLYTWAARLLATGVCAIAFVASYNHIKAVALDAGESPLVATLIPLSIDGVVLTGILAWLADEANSRSIRPWALVAVWLGVAGTIAANLRSAEPNLTAYMIAAAPPVALLIATKVLLWEGRPKPAQESDTSDQDRDREPLDPHSEDAITRAITAAGLARANPYANPRDVAKSAGVSVRHATRVLAANRPSANGSTPDHPEPTPAAPAPTETS